MTSEDALRALTSYRKAVEEDENKNRSGFRSPVKEWRNGLVADISLDSENFQGTTRQVLRVDITGATIVRSVQPIGGGSADFSFNLRLPSGNNPKPTLDSELGQMTESAVCLDETVDSILDIKGRTIDAVEDTHTFTGNRFIEDPAGPKTNREGKRGDWKDVEMSFPFYRITKMSLGSGSNGTGIEPRPEVLTAALRYLNDKTQDQFTKGFAKEITADSDGVVLAPEDKAALTSYVFSGKFWGMAAGNGAKNAEGVWTI